MRDTLVREDKKVEENKNTLSVAYSGQTNAAPVSYASVAPSRERKLLIILGILLFIGLLVGGLAWLVFYNNNQSPVSSQFNNSQIDLSDIVESDFSNTKELTILGQLNIAGGFAIIPAPLPSNPKAGQIYYDQVANALSYYNGSQFVVLGEQQEIQVGGGLSNTDNVLANTGVLSLQGSTGNVALTAGPGITITGTTISANVTGGGVLSLASGSPSLIINNDGNGNLTITSSGGGTGNVQTGGGTNGRIAKFTGVDTIADSIISESGSTITVGGSLNVTNDSTITGNLGVGGALTLGLPLGVPSGGTGASSFAINGVLIGQGAGAIAAVTAGGADMCLKSTGGAPVFDPCVVNTEAVTDLNGLTGSLTIANATGLVDTITIDDASTTQKGIAQFNATNFTAGSGVINTVQNIHVGATPTFGGLTLNGALGVGANNITGTNFSVQGSSGNITTIGTISSGLINGQTISGSANFTGTVTAAGNLTLSAGDLAVNGGDITSTGALAVTGGNTLTLASTGANDLLLQTNGSTRLTASGSTGNLLATGNLTLQGGAITVGTSSQAGAIVLHDGNGDTATIEIDVSGLSGNQSYALPDTSGVICLDIGNCAGSGTGVTSASGGNTNRLAKFTAAQNIEDSTITDDGTNVTTTVDVIIQGGDLTVGTTSQLASLVLHDGNGQSTTLQAGNSTGNLTFILPTNAGTANQCLKQSGTGNQLVWDTCDGGGGGVSTTLQNAYNNGNTITTSDARDIDIVLADTTTDSNLDVVVADGSTSFVSFSRANGAGTADPAQLLLIDNSDTDRALPVGIKLQAAAGGMTVAIDATDAEIVDALSVAANNIVGTTGNLDFSNFDVTGATGDVVTAGDLAVNGGDVTSTGGLTLVASSGNVSLNSSGTIELLDNTNVTGNLDASGTLAVGTGNALTVDASGNIITAGDLAVNGGNITNTGSLTIGVTGQTLTLQGSASTTLSATDSGNTTTLSFTTPTASTTLTLPALSAGSYELCTDSGNCSTGTLQDAYDNSANPEIVLSGGTGALTIRDGNPALGANLIEIQSNDGTVTYLAVDASGIEVTGSVEASGNISTTTGALVINGQTRLDNAGNLTNIGNLTATGAITIASTGGGNDITLSSADQIILNGGGTIELQDNTNVTGNLSATGTYNTNTFNGNTLTFGTAGTATISSAALQALNITGNAASTWSTSSGDLNVQAAADFNLGNGGGSIINVGTNAAAHTIGIGTSASGDNDVSIGSANAGSTLFLRGGGNSSAISIQSAAGGTIGIGANGVTNTIQIGNNAGAVAQTINVGNNTAGNTDIIIGGTNAGSTLVLEAGTAAGAILIGNGATAHGIQIGTGAAVQTISIGSTNSTSALTLQAGTGGLNIQTQGGTLGIGNNAVAQTLVIGNDTGGTGVSILCGTGTCGFGNNATAHTTILGSSTGTSATSVQAGTGGLALTSGANVTIGASDTTGTLTIIDTKTDTGDPTGVNGAMYYNSFYGRFRCYQNNVWIDCVDGGNSQSPETVVFASNDTFDKADYPGMTAVRYKVQGAGGSGGGTNACGVGEATEGGGGGAGAYAEGFVAASSLSASETVTVGTGGAGSSGAVGNDGGDSSFGSFGVAGGGNAPISVGTCTSTNTNTVMGTGGLATAGDIQIAGSYGKEGRVKSGQPIFGNEGGASQLGPGGQVVHSFQANGAAPPSGYGGGGSGGRTQASGAATAGGNGANGVVIVEVLYSGGGGGASAVEYVRAEMTADESTDVSPNDHIKFNSVQASSGSGVTLDTTTTYTNGAGASVGRFTLAAGKTYMLRSTIPRVVFGAGDSSMQYQWYNVTAGAALGTKGGALSATWSLTDIANDPYAEAIISPSVTTLIELRITDVSGSVSTIGDGGSGRMPSAFIEVLSDGTKVAQFQGATASTDGQQGFVPKPVAGQEGSLLVGNGSWSSGLAFVNGNLGLGTTNPFNGWNFTFATASPGLHLEGTDPFIGLNDTGGERWGIEATTIGLTILNDTDNLRRLIIDNDGEVGIGRTDPFHILDIEATSPTLRIQSVINDATGSALRFTETDNYQGGFIRYDALNNILSIGVHNNDNTTLGDDNNAINISRSSGNIQVGTSDATGILLILDTKTGSSDPTAAEGGMYYNSTLGKFRCRENGVWVNCISDPPDMVSFTSSGSFSKGSFPGLKGVKITAVGGGGAGGGRQTGFTNSLGAGGGAGGWCVEYIPASSLASSETVTIGAGGTGASGAAGGSGGNSSFGAFCTGEGGSGGGIASSSTGGAYIAAAGGAGGSATGGDHDTGGEQGGDAFALVGTFTGPSGAGASTPFGRGGASRADSTGNGLTGGRTAGGGGARGTASSSAGGNGGGGLVIVELYF